MKIPCKECILFARCNSEYVERSMENNILNIGIYNCKILGDSIRSQLSIKSYEKSIKSYEKFRQKVLGLFDCLDENYNYWND